MTELERVASFLVGIGFGIDWAADAQFVKAPRCLREPMARAAWEQNGRDPSVEDYAGLLDEGIAWER